MRVTFLARAPPQMPAHRRTRRVRRANLADISDSELRDVDENFVGDKWHKDLVYCADRTTALDPVDTSSDDDDADVGTATAVSLCLRANVQINFCKQVVCSENISKTSTMRLLKALDYAREYIADIGREANLMEVRAFSTSMRRRRRIKMATAVADEPRESDGDSTEEYSDDEIETLPQSPPPPAHEDDDPAFDDDDVESTLTEDEYETADDSDSGDESD